MKIKLNTVTPPPRKLVAVIGECGMGLFLPSKGGNRSVFYATTGFLSTTHDTPLEDLLKGNNGRQAVYEGDTITLQF